MLMKQLYFILICITLSSCIIHNPKPEDCDVVNIYVSEIKEGTSFDIVLNDLKGDHFYINRGLERGLYIDSLKKYTLHQTVRLHLPKFWIGTSEHIAQIETKSDTLFTEFY